MSKILDIFLKYLKILIKKKIQRVKISNLINSKIKKNIFPYHVSAK